MGTYGDIRTRFEIGLNSINEAATTIEGVILPALSKKLGKGRVNNKSGNKDVRFDLGGDEKKAPKQIEKALKFLKIKDVSIDVVGPGDYANGGNSGKFFTYIVTFKSPIKMGKVDIKEGDSFKIVDNNPPKGSIKSKELTPSSLNIPEDTDLNKATLKKETLDNIKKQYGKSNPFMKSFLTELYNLVDSHVPSISFDSPMKLESFNVDIKYDENIKEAIDSLGATDINTIGKDFGEILGAALMLNIVKTQNGISFPSGNNPLTDFNIDGYGISSKYKAGAAPTLSNIIKNLNKKNFTEESEVQLYDLFKIVEENNVIDGYIKGADFMNLPSALKLKELTGLKNLDKKTLEEFIQNGIKLLGRDGFFFKYVKPLATYSGRGITQLEKVDWGKLDKNNRYVGLLSYPLSLQLIDKLNGKLGDGDLYINTLRKIVSKLDVKQLYMDVKLKSEEINFYLKGFDDSDAKLTFEAPNVSTPNPGNGKLGFKMK